MAGGCAKRRSTFRVGGRNVAEAVRMNIAEAQRFFDALELTAEESAIAKDPHRDPPAAEVPE